jgi:predicted nucleic acid-binding protein
VREKGSTSIDHLFVRAEESDQIRLVFSAWNIGEVLGALDERHRKKLLTDDEYSSALFNFSDETLRMARRGSTSILPVAGRILTASWQVLVQEHIYAADALQIASCKESECDFFLSVDQRLVEAARNQGLTGLDPAKEEKKLTAL